jgi:hypothetical protein
MSDSPCKVFLEGRVYQADIHPRYDRIVVPKVYHIMFKGAVLYVTIEKH